MVQVTIFVNRIYYEKEFRFRLTDNSCMFDDEELQYSGLFHCSSISREIRKNFTDKEIYLHKSFSKSSWPILYCQWPTS